MKLVFVSLFVLIVAVSAREMQLHSGEPTVCAEDGRAYKVSFNALTFSNESFIDLNNIMGLEDVVCDIDHTSLLLVFDGAESMAAFQTLLQPVETFITAFGQYTDCNGTKPDGSLILRRVISHSTVSESSLEVGAVPARYDEIFQDANITVSSTNASCTDSGFDKKICVGANVNTGDCASAKESLPIYSNKYVDVTCSDCFVGFHVDVFMDISIHWFKLKKLAAGFKNVGFNMAEVFDLSAHASWSVGTDKTLKIIPETTVLNFKVGPVPIRIWFELPMELKASASFDATAEAKVGAEATIDFGGLYVQWDRDHHWQIVTPKPSPSYNSIVSGNAEFHGTASANLIPSLKMHMDNVLEYDLSMNAGVNLDITGDTATKQICLDVDYDVALTQSAEVKINLPWHLLHKDWKWGPKVIYDSGTQTLVKKCVTAS